MVSNPHALKLKLSEVATIKKIEGRAKECRRKEKEGGRRHDE